MQVQNLFLDSNLYFLFLKLGDPTNNKEKQDGVYYSETSRGEDFYLYCSGTFFFNSHITSQL